MSQWEYQKIDLSNISPKIEDIDLLNDAGRDGWELVATTPNHIAYMKRLVAAPKRPAARADK